MKLLKCVLLIPLTILLMAHSWYPNECCSGKDCKPIPCEEITEVSSNLMRYKDLEFKGPMIRDTKDNSCHICTYEYILNGTKLYMPRCIFVHRGV